MKSLWRLIKDDFLKYLLHVNCHSHACHTKKAFLQLEESGENKEFLETNQ